MIEEKKKKHKNTEKKETDIRKTIRRKGRKTENQKERKKGEIKKERKESKKESLNGRNKEAKKE